MASLSVSLNLNGSVGQGGKNQSHDVLAVKNRLADLGFIVTRDSIVNSEIIDIIKLFQSIIKGETTIVGDGRIDLNGPTLKFLQAANAPQWLEMPKGSASEGFINHDERQGDNHDFGTNWMVETIQAAAQIYLTVYLSSHPTAALIQTNDLSKPKGGITPVHATHQTGLSCDLRLPRKDGQAGGITFRDAQFDRDAMRAMLKAIHDQDKYKIRRIFFNDLSLTAEGLCKNAPSHDNHVHIDIISPQPQ
ncbi:hypothetical protein K4039_18720 [Lyngbya sp. CCAP 1446/10]|uniref:hypothetical protein n=1 Tax=Lyngbya sp. CCAP 1446/10 TaxID=439293 RepID=UPI00223809C8|nr:hypothetical protein [Lyngbya sp. CCAP 1446/10]MCW6052071.1 hypothetical protein [Lyngbya sp. CCAP 1446/10]